MRKLLLHSVTVTVLALSPSAFAQGPGGGSHSPAAGGASPGVGGGDRGAAEPHAVQGEHAGGADRGGEMKGDPRSGGAQRTDGDKEGGRDTAPKSENEKPGAKGDDRQDRMKTQESHDRAGAGEKDNKRGGAERADGEHGGARGAKISSEQRTKITTTLRGGSAKRLDHVDFSIRVGVAVPRSYQYYPLPPEIIEIVPEYRGYDYILVGEQILIIDPGSGEIVYVI